MYGLGRRKWDETAEYDSAGNCKFTESHKLEEKKRGKQYLTVIDLFAIVDRTLQKIFHVYKNDN